MRSAWVLIDVTALVLLFTVLVPLGAGPGAHLGIVRVLASLTLVSVALTQVLSLARHDGRWQTGLITGFRVVGALPLVVYALGAGGRGLVGNGFGDTIVDGWIVPAVAAAALVLPAGHARNRGGVLWRLAGSGFLALGLVAYVLYSLRAPGGFSSSGWLGSSVTVALTLAAFVANVHPTAAWAGFAYIVVEVVLVAGGATMSFFDVATLAGLGLLTAPVLITRSASPGPTRPGWPRFASRGTAVLGVALGLTYAALNLGPWWVGEGVVTWVIIGGMVVGGATVLLVGSLAPRSGSIVEMVWGIALGILGLGTLSRSDRYVGLSVLTLFVLAMVTGIASLISQGLGDTLGTMSSAPMSTVATDAPGGAGTAHATAFAGPKVPGFSQSTQVAPSLTATVVVTLFFGVFGLIPASLHTNRMTVSGVYTSRYYKAFGWSLAGAFVADIVVYVLLFVWVGSLG